MTDFQKILAVLKQELELSFDHLEYSYNKISTKQLQTSTQDPESLEVFEALVSRFARATDIFISKYLRSFAIKDDPAFQGSLIDTIHYAEKKGLINSARQWIEIRELRNKIAHEYATKDLGLIFEQVLVATPGVLQIRSNLK